jgi:hypothetical protein
LKRLADAGISWPLRGLPEIAALRAELVPEFPVYGMLGDAADQTALAGRADAIAVRDGQVSVMVDWKSDVPPPKTSGRMPAKFATIWPRSTRRMALSSI